MNNEHELTEIEKFVHVRLHVYWKAVERVPSQALWWWKKKTIKFND